MLIIKSVITIFTAEGTLLIHSQAHTNTQKHLFESVRQFYFSNDHIVLSS